MFKDNINILLVHEKEMPANRINYEKLTTSKSKIGKGLDRYTQQDTECCSSGCKEFIPKTSVGS